jgi:hypothetical protein
MWPSFFKAAAAAHLLHLMMGTLKRKAAVAAFARLEAACSDWCCCGGRM